MEGKRLLGGQNELYKNVMCGEDVGGGACDDDDDDDKYVVQEEDGGGDTISAICADEAGPEKTAKLETSDSQSGDDTEEEADKDAVTVRDNEDDGAERVDEDGITVGVELVANEGVSFSRSKISLRRGITCAKSGDGSKM